MLSTKVSFTVTTLALVFSIFGFEKSHAGDIYPEAATAAPVGNEVLASCVARVSTQKLMGAVLEADQGIRGMIDGWRKQMQLPESKESLSHTVAILETLSTPKRGPIQIEDYNASSKEFAAKMQQAPNCGEVQILLTIQHSKTLRLACQLFETIGTDVKVPECEAERVVTEKSRI